MLRRKSLAEAEAAKGYLDVAKFDSLSDAEIERLMVEDPDFAPPTENLAPLLGVAEVRHKLGLTQTRFARKLGVSLATLREWERGFGRTDPAMQALLRILDAAREPESASAPSSLLPLHNLVVDGRRMAVRLEASMWEGLQDIARRRETSVNALVTEIERNRDVQGLTAAIRVFIVEFYRSALEAAGRSEGVSRHA